ncbi:precorrin-2 C(20)-methyltransferase [Petralouisia muris]|uniref:Precorrin-2 C(20)-methyltransferase n=1 Tax=Petralouisia muris TaxID=3032872 RepID=A0AC61S0X6_9FIRM|nr:precorrin-2 C(20)-methyltransferase [Petralouisia muris]TGY97556.1 precorrin-2 C(20)-methyltransferase [Petralouisia muris]
MSGILYGAGVGPGDPELMTLKAVRLVKENNVIALPGKNPKETVAYQIAAAAVPELADKELLAVYMPMTHDREEREKRHREGAYLVETYLKQGKNVVFLTLGDPSVYSTFTYIQKIAEADGFQTQLVSGVPSFCAAAARMNMPLAIWNEQIHIFPAVHHLSNDLPDAGTCVLMKSGSKMDQVKEILKKSGRDAVMIENCGTGKEQVYLHVDDIPDTAGYYSLIISKEAEKK